MLSASDFGTNPQILVSNLGLYHGAAVLINHKAFLYAILLSFALLSQRN